MLLCSPLFDSQYCSCLYISHFRTRSYISSLGLLPLWHWWYFQSCFWVSGWRGSVPVVRPECNFCLLNTELMISPCPQATVWVVFFLPLIVISKSPVSLLHVEIVPRSGYPTGADLQVALPASRSWDVIYNFSPITTLHLFSISSSWRWLKVYPYLTYACVIP